MAAFGKFWNRTLFSWLEMDFTINEAHLIEGEHGVVSTHGNARQVPFDTRDLSVYMQRKSTSHNLSFIGGLKAMQSMILIEKVHLFNPIRFNFPYAQ